MHKIVSLALLAACMFLLIFPTEATHIRGGSIRVERISTTEYKYKIIISAFTDNGNPDPVLFGDGLLDFGDGSEPLAMSTQDVVRVDQGNDVVFNTINITYTFQNPGAYTLSYQEPNRNADILNIANPVNTPFYTETLITVSDDYPGFSSTEFLTDPIFYGQAGLGFEVSMGAVDPNGFKLRYELVTPQAARLTAVSNYRFPGDLAVNPLTGLVTWNTLFDGEATVGEFVFTVKVKQFGPRGQLLGAVNLDIMIILEDGLSEHALTDNGALDENNKLLVEPGQQAQFKVFLKDKEALTNGLELSLASELDDFPGNIEFSTYDSASGDYTIKVGQLSITPGVAVDRDNPYLISIRGVSNTKSGPLIAKDQNYLVYTRDVDDIVDVPTGLNPGEGGPALHLFPNPTARFLYLPSFNGVPMNLVLLQPDGKVAARWTLQGGQAVDLQAYPRGLYVYQLMQKGRLLTTGKFLLE